MDMFRNAVFCLALSFPVAGIGQSVYPNIDFETGTLAGWSGYTGTCCPVAANAPGLEPLRHTIVSGTGADPYSLGQLPVVAPGGQYSLRLGNDSTHAEAERITYTLMVQPQATLLVFRYAVVFEYPANHPPSKQPRFEAALTDAGGQPIDCAAYSVVSSDSPAGFFQNGNYRIRPWTDVAVDLSDLTGQTVTLSFATGDCGMGGHFGYAYLDASARAMAVDVSPCQPDGSLILTAPPGFSQYAWSTGQTTQQIVLSAYNGGTTVNVELTAWSGCTSVIGVTLPPSIPTTSFSWQPGCGLSASFHASAAGPPVTAWTWDFGDGTKAYSGHPEHTYGTAGIYPVMLTAEAGGCRSTCRHDVVIEPAVTAAFAWSPQIPCAGDRIRFTDGSTAVRGIVSSRYWEFGDFSQSIAADPVHVYIQPGTYAVTLVVSTAEGCSATAGGEVTVWPSDSCRPPDDGLWVPKAFTPNGDGVNDYFQAAGTGELISLEVFDRWGKAVFAGSGAASRWDGTARNRKPAPDGVYSYLITARSADHDIRQITGYVLLLR